MTEVRFSYDERLLDRCVKSSLYQRVIARRDASQTRTTAAAAALSSSSNAARMSSGGGDDDDDVVEDKQQVAPASDHLLLHRADQAMRENQMEDSDDPQACVALFHEHQDHYYGQQPAATPPATTVSVASYLYDLRNDEAAAETETESSATSSLSPSTLQRFEAFVENVGFVHRHNSNIAGAGHHRHRVALNRFSDRRPDEIFPGSSDMDDEGAALGGTSARRHLLRHADPEQADPLMLDEEAESGFDRRVLAQLERDGVVIHLDDAETVMSLSLEGIGKGSMNHLNPKKYEKIYHKSKTLTLDPDEPLRQFETPDVLQELDGAILSIRPEQPAEHDDDDDRNNNNDNKDEDADGPPPSRNPVFVSNDPPEQDEDEFARNLNWATADNPDGVAIVHEPIDQGLCGACWAFAATGSLEASASRRAAYNAFRTYAKRHPFATVNSLINGDDYDDDDQKKMNDTATTGNLTNATGALIHPHWSPAVAYAQGVQVDSFRRLNLSIQELIDCDTSGDQGCTGGNPLLSFYFIHRYGLTTWDKYPYVGHQDECRERLIKQPVATVKSWGIVSPNHEAHMELVLRHIGPIAAGVNGASPSFLAYSGGIYDNPYCRQGANHALLITGYGEEVVRGKTVRFWHARNSWGTGWGEDGYVRIKRNDGVKGSTGVCGIARSPSVALGGVLLPMRGEIVEDDAMSSLLATHGPMERLCFRFGLGFNDTCLATTTWLDGHKVLLLALFGVGLFLASIYLLTHDIRRRHRRRTERRRRLSGCSRDEESSALLPSPPSDGNGHGGYGSAAH